MYIIWPK